MIGIYWVVFALALNVSWPASEGRPAMGFILPFTTGLTIYLYLVELVTSSLELFVARRNLVLKSPLPLWVLWLSNYFRATVVSFVTLVLLILISVGAGVLTAKGLLLAVPVIMLMLLLFAPLSMILALVGPFAGDLNNAIPVLMRVLFYTAPITFPMTIIPTFARPYFWVNPLTSLVELLRDTLLFGQAPATLPFLSLALAALSLGVSAAWLYNRVAGAIHDVI